MMHTKSLEGSTLESERQADADARAARDATSTARKLAAATDYLRMEVQRKDAEQLIKATPEEMIKAQDEETMAAQDALIAALLEEAIHQFDRIKCSH